MGNGIRIGTRFGSFNASVQNFSSKYDTDYVESSASINNGKEMAYIFSDKKTKKENITAYQGYGTDGNGRWKVFSIIQMGAYTFSRESHILNQDEIFKPANKFNRIDTPTHYAIDVNRNGRVDDGEVFSKEENPQPVNFEAYGITDSKLLANK